MAKIGKDYYGIHALDFLFFIFKKKTHFLLPNLITTLLFLADCLTFITTDNHVAFEDILTTSEMTPTMSRHDPKVVIIQTTAMN